MFRNYKAHYLRRWSIVSLIQVGTFIICEPKFLEHGQKVRARFRAFDQLQKWWNHSNSKNYQNCLLVTCSDADWSSSFDNEGWSKCDDIDNPFITAFFRSDPVVPKNNPISLLDKARCCSASVAYNHEKVDCRERCWHGFPT